MRSKLIVLDACALTLLFEETSEDPTRADRQEKVRFHFAKYQQEGAQFIVPAPALAELYAAGESGKLIADALNQRKERIRIEAFGLEATELTGLITAKRLPERGSTPRPVVKFDSLIAAMAVTCKADLLVTTDSDLEKCMKHVPEKDRVRVVDAQK